MLKTHLVKEIERLAAMARSYDQAAIQFRCFEKQQKACRKAGYRAQADRVLYRSGYCGKNTRKPRKNLDRIPARSRLTGCSS